MQLSFFVCLFTLALFAYSLLLVRMSFTLAPSTPNACVYTYTRSFLPYFFFLDEDVKAESSSEVADPDDTQAQTQEQPQQQSSQAEASSGSSQVSGSGILRKPDPPDLADRSSQSSFTSQDGTGKHERGLLVLRKQINTAFGIIVLLNCLFESMLIVLLH